MCNSKRWAKHRALACCRERCITRRVILTFFVCFVKDESRRRSNPTTSFLACASAQRTARIVHSLCRSPGPIGKRWRWRTPTRHSPLSHTAGNTLPIRPVHNPFLPTDESGLDFVSSGGDSALKGKASKWRQPARMSESESDA